MLIRKISLVHHHRADAIVPRRAIRQPELAQVCDAASRCGTRSVEIWLFVEGYGGATGHLNRRDIVVQLDPSSLCPACLAEIVALEVPIPIEAGAIPRPLRRPSSGIPPWRTTRPVASPSRYAKRTAATTIHPDPSAVIAPSLPPHTRVIAVLFDQLYVRARVRNRAIVPPHILRRTIKFLGRRCCCRKQTEKAHHRYQHYDSNLHFVPPIEMTASG